MPRLHYFVRGDTVECLSCGEPLEDAEKHYEALELPPKGGNTPEPDGDGDGEGDGENTEGEGQGDEDGDSDEESEGDGDGGDEESEGEGQGQGEAEGQAPAPPERMVSVWGVPHNRDKTCPEDGCVAIEDGVAMVSPGGTFHLRDARPFHEVNSCDEMGCEPFTE